MKINSVTVNKNEQNPDGVPIDLIEPESKLEQDCLAYLIGGFLRNLREAGQLSLDLPERFRVEYGANASFVLSETGAGGGYYQAPKPALVVGLRKAGRGFDMVFRDLRKQSSAAAAESPGEPIDETHEDIDEQPSSVDSDAGEEKSE